MATLSLVHPLINAGSLSQCVQVLYACLCIGAVVDVNVHALCALHVLILNEH